MQYTPGILFFIASLLVLNTYGQVPAIVVHGGAGTIERGSMSDSLETAIRNHLQTAVDRAYAILEGGGTALDAVEVAIMYLEEVPHFNAGIGAVMTADGQHTLDASIMDGKHLNAGAVASVTTVRRPIQAARAVMEHSPHVLLAGEGAELFAKLQGLELVSNDFFTTPRIKAAWEAGQKRQGALEAPAMETIPGNAHEPLPEKFGTVGAVAVDAAGNIAAGTSTGGMMNKRYGRIGDSPIIGAGTYADNATCGVSATGHGEYFIRIGVAKEISDQMRFAERPLAEAAHFTIHDRLSALGGSGGIIALDAHGRVTMEFNTTGMYRAFRNAHETHIAIYGTP